MNKNEITLESLVSDDADSVIAKVMDLEPTDRERLLLESVRLAVVEGDHLLLTRTLLVTQHLLAERCGLLDASQFLPLMESLLERVNESDSPRVQRQVLIVAGLIARRLGDALSFLSSDSERALLALEAKFAGRGTGTIQSTLQAARSSRLASSRKKIPELPFLDVAQAKLNVLSDIGQDWLADPWGWPEFLRIEPEGIGRRLREAKCGWTFALDVAKEAGGIRPAILLNPLDRTALQCLADELSLVATSELPKWVYGWRVARSMPTKGRYEDNSREWKAFKKHIESCSEKHDFVLRVDVSSFFQSVNTESLLSSLGRYYKKRGTLDRLSHYFADFRSRRNGDGLPQRCIASSVLAHIPLRAIDRYLARLSTAVGSETIEPLRWMDDIWLFGDSDTNLRHVANELESLLHTEGLSLNPEKTILAECETEVDLLIDASGGDVDQEYDRSSFSEKVLGIASRIDEAHTSDLRLLLNFQGADANQVQATLVATFKLLRLEKFNHSANRVAEFLLKQGVWRDHVQWYVELAKRHVDPHAWVVAAWGQMLPTEFERSSDLKVALNFFQRHFDKSIQASLTPLAAHRLSSWDPADSRELLLGYLANCKEDTNEFLVRSVALAAMHAGVDRHTILGRVSGENRKHVGELL
ncbi:MAG: hypothetical protein Aurels2KO_28090 [Aureliella sp.]